MLATLTGERFFHDLFHCSYFKPGFTTSCVLRMDSAISEKRPESYGYLSQSLTQFVFEPRPCHPFLLGHGAHFLNIRNKVRRIKDFFGATYVDCDIKRAWISQASLTGATYVQWTVESSGQVEYCS